MTQTNAVAKLKVVLADVTPAVERVLAVPFAIRLDRLHQVIQVAFGWTDTHLWEFRVKGIGFGIPDPDCAMPGDPYDARKAKLVDVIEDTGARTFRYLYDFGDGWEHVIRLASVAPSAPGIACPLLLSGSGRRPPEDSGGPFGYPELLEALADPTHESHEDAMERLGSGYDPTAESDWMRVNQDLEALGRIWARGASGRTRSRRT